jgi:glycosyltransferase involved in cell wall biosynthesis
MPSFDVTAIINAHREGLLAQPSLRSLSEAVKKAEDAGLTVEIVSVLDRPDPTTREVFERFANEQRNIRLMDVDHGDPGLSRNSGVSAAQGAWIALLDADDLWCSNWLSDAYRAAESDGRQVAWHPEVNVYFGINPHIFTHVDMEDPSYEHAGLALYNYWTSLCLAPRSLFLEVPYRGSALNQQIGYEDWTWNMDVVASGALHKIVPGTGHAIRMKEVSVLRQTNAMRSLPIPSELFRHLLSDRKGQRDLISPSTERRFSRVPPRSAPGDDSASVEA